VRTTPFPARPCDVVALTVPEFTCGLDLHADVTVDTVCQRFPVDVNRALVWFIRFRALTAWCERGEIGAWLRTEPARLQHACEIAASFDVNDEWTFDADAFRSAVCLAAGSARSHGGSDSRPDRSSC
jgi:hypothetical protein